MKKFYSILAVALSFAIGANANTLTEKSALQFTPSAKVLKQKSPKARILADELVTPPESATFEYGWAISGSYINNQNPFSNTNNIVLAFDGNDIYIQGMVYLCPDAWIKGTVEGTQATFANGQYCGRYVSDDVDEPIYACGSEDGEALSDILFEYDSEGKTLTLIGYYIENTVTDDFNFFFYSYDIVISKPLPAPLNFTAEPFKTGAEFSWIQEDNADLWNIRYRKTVSEDILNRFYDFEEGAQIDEFVIIDADGDGYSWEFDNVKQNAYSGTGVAHSASFINGVGALTPDNWLITPAVNLGGEFSFWYRGQDASYCEEVFRVYIIEGEDADITKAEALSADITAGEEYVQYKYDLSGYAGKKGRLAIRHYNVTDMFWFNIDDLKLTVPGGQDVNPWSVIEQVSANPYVLDGLDEETEYEAGIQAIAGEKLSEWSNTIKFTTADSGVEGVIADKKADNVWYNLLGVRLNGKPSQAGIYINGGKKVVIR